MIDFNIILFDGFETLDAFGPAEIIGKMPQEYQLEYFSLQGGIVTSSQQVRVMTLPMAEMNVSGILLIPGGMGTRSLVDDTIFIDTLRQKATQAAFVLTVCTGSGLLAKTGLLDGVQATSNKLAFSWAQSVGEEVEWIRQARWVVAGRIYTSSGVSAGMDMILGFISDRHGREHAVRLAHIIEYIWNENRENDPFAI